MERIGQRNSSAIAWASQRTVLAFANPAKCVPNSSAIHRTSCSLGSLANSRFRRMAYISSAAKSTGVIQRPWQPNSARTSSSARLIKRPSVSYAAAKSDTTTQTLCFLTAAVSKLANTRTAISATVPLPTA